MFLSCPSSNQSDERKGAHIHECTPESKRSLLHGSKLQYPPPNKVCPWIVTSSEVSETYSCRLSMRGEVNATICKCCSYVTARKEATIQKSIQLIDKHKDTPIGKYHHPPMPFLLFDMTQSDGGFCCCSPFILLPWAILFSLHNFDPPL